jgi:hypothetical protein
MKQLLQGRSGRKNRANATLKTGFNSVKTHGWNQSGWKTAPIKSIPKNMSNTSDRKSSDQTPKVD